MVGIYSLINGQQIFYSAGNQYEKLYVHEDGDALRAMLLWHRGSDVRPMLLPWLDFRREGLPFHQAGLKLQLLASYYHLTHDAAFFRDQRRRWLPQAERILTGREVESGLFPREQYCGDIADPVCSLNSNSNAWRGLRDFAAALRVMDEEGLADQMSASASEFRAAILKAVDQSVREDARPPFVPIALFGEEQPYDSLSATRLGGYYDLMAPLVLGSGVLGDESKRTRWMIDYLQQHGGLCMGMMRCHPANKVYTVKQAVNDLYTLRYLLTLLRLDDV